MDPEQLRSSLHQKEQDFAPKQQTNQPKQHKQAQPRKKNPQELFSWVAPLRAYKRKSIGILRFYVAIAVLLSLIAIFFKEFILVIPVWTTLFLVYVLTITPPIRVRHTITKFGIVSADITYRWEALSHFYFIKKFDYTVMVVSQNDPNVHPLYLVIPKKSIHDEVLHILSEHIVYIQKPQKTFTDNMAEWLTRLMPEEENQAPASKPVEQPPSHQTFVPSE